LDWPKYSLGRCAGNLRNHLIGAYNSDGYNGEADGNDEGPEWDQKEEINPCGDARISVPALRVLATIKASTMVERRARG
jgi:hypothetical protein